MAYQNITFPAVKLMSEFSEEKIVPVTIISNYAKEYRINRFSAVKRKFTYPGRNIKSSDWITLSAFLTSVNYQQDSFNYVHPFTGEAIKVRFESIPVGTNVAFNMSGVPTIIQITDIILLEVFNE